MTVIPGVQYSAQSSTITSQTDNTLTFQWSGDTIAAGNRYFLGNTLAALGAPKEYYYNSTNSTLYLRAPGDANPNSQTVEVRKREYGFDFGTKSYISVSGFRLMAASVDLTQGNHNLIDNLQILYPSGIDRNNGVPIGGSYNTVRNSEIAYASGAGIVLSGGSHNLIDNNVIHDVGSDGTNSGFVATFTGGNTITNNTMYNSGRLGIWVSGDNTSNTMIKNNDISRFGYLTKDLGGIYFWGTDATGSIVAYNRVHDSRSPGVNMGIYLDNSSSGVTVHHNLVTNTQVGVAVNKPGTNENVYNNTLWDVNTAMTTWGLGDLTNVNTINNLSNDGSWQGNTINHNWVSGSSPFVNAAAGDYTLRSGIAPPSPVDYGAPISDITPDGDATPDVGSFQSGETPWTAGASFKTWRFANQIAAPLAAAVAVTPNNVQTTTGSLIAGRTTSSSSSTNRSFLKFDLSGVTGPILSAVVRMYENTAPTLATGGVGLYAVTSTWDPNSVSYDQATASTGTAFYDSANLDLYTDIDVTSIVQGWISDPSSNFGFCLRSDAESTGYSAKYFEGMYGVTSPQLILTVPEPGALSLVLSAALAGLGILPWRKSVYRPCFRISALAIRARKRINNMRNYRLYLFEQFAPDCLESREACQRNKTEGEPVRTVYYLSVSLLALVCGLTVGPQVAVGLQYFDASKIRGFNYQPSFGSSGVEIWIDKFDATTVDRELALGHQYFPGMNTVRLWLSPDAYIKNPTQFTQNFETTLQSLAKYGIKAIPTLFNNWHSVPDFGGISPEMINYWFRDYGQSGEAPNYVWRPYLTAMFQGHASDSRILAWDLCNEPFNSGSADTYTPWLQHTYNLAKTLGAEQPIGVSVGASVSSLAIVEPFSDVLMIHPYFASSVDWSGLQTFANQHGKELLATEFIWGSLDDATHVAYIQSDLNVITSQGIGFLAHGLYESYVADLHRPEYGPVSTAGYMAFINMDGSLRTGHGVFNNYAPAPEPSAGALLFIGLIGLFLNALRKRRQ